ncbi:MAG: hypothetical protein AMXMBFR12_07930 [Candidatus Babeliales bacterium]
MKKNQMIFYIAISIIHATQAMQNQMQVFMFVSLLSAHENQVVLAASQAEQIKGYPHQPNQNFQLKKIHQPHVSSRRHFTQHHK